MAGRSKRGRGGQSGMGRRRWWWRLVLVMGLGVLAAGLFWGWRRLEPAERQDEVRHLVQNYLGRRNQTTVLELAADLWRVYRADGVACEYRAGGQVVYGGLPVAADRAVRVLRNQTYWVGYDERRRNPAWVAYRLFDAAEDLAGQRPVEFLTDLRTVAQVSSEQYTGSGFDRGHLAPNYGIGRCFGPQAQVETFLMSNIVPQRHAFNAGVWSQLERREAVNYPGRFREIWVIAGPLYNPERIRELPSGIPIPDAFFKIMVDERLGRIRVQAFRFPHDTASPPRLGEALCPVDELERLTGFDFFPELPAETQAELERSRPKTAW